MHVSGVLRVQREGSKSPLEENEEGWCETFEDKRRDEAPCRVMAR
jgi:hypothetical protein